MPAILLLLGLLMSTQNLTGAQSIGVCYGRNGNNLPSQQETVDLYKSNGIGRMRIYDPDSATLEALRGSNIELMIGVPNTVVQSLGSDASAATQWVQTNIVSYADVKFRYIAVGNEINPDSDPVAQYVGPALENVQRAITAVNLQGQIKVSTAISTGLLADSSPPSDGVFRDVGSFINPIINFLVTNGAPLLANIYPYFSDPQSNLPYALFTASGVVVQDGEYQYSNLFDAILDSVYSALEKAGGSALQIVVSESGWPSAGGDVATVENAGTYYRNLINHVNEGTPKRAGQAIETYLFAMYDENLKDTAEEEKHFGLFSPDKQPKYQLSFT